MLKRTSTALAVLLLLPLLGAVAVQAAGPTVYSLSLIHI